MTMQPSGFTLIELIVVIGIVLMMSGLAVSTFSRARDKDLVSGEARQVADLIQGVLRKAGATQKPTECADVTLDKYQILFKTAKVIEVHALCVGEDVITDTLTLKTSDITNPLPGPSSTIDFSTLYGGVSATTIDVCGQNYLYKIEVGSGGSISQPIDSGPC